MKFTLQQQNYFNSRDIIFIKGNVEKYLCKKIFIQKDSHSHFNQVDPQTSLAA